MKMCWLKACAKYAVRISHLPPLPPKPVRYAMALDGLESFEVKDALRVLVTGRVSLPGRFHVCHCCLQDALHA